ncbi:hypothetical protein C8J56DRAFT_456317 [Mycena floridula]|nr:hypothetical protein C8J56DRAFT_456317 [Mycena floridula]
MQRAVRQDTYDLRDQIHSDDLQGHADAANYTDDEEQHSVLEDDDSDIDDGDEDMIDDDGSSDLSIPNESIDFDLVYAFHSFAATVEGQANVVKGDSLFLMDDSNSYWWLVRVLKTQEVGYIPAENIETPFERLARLNKHRNVDLASATQVELQDGLHASQDRLRSNLGSRQGSSPSPIPRGPRSRQSRNVNFYTGRLDVYRYPPAVWREEEEEDPDIEWDLEGKPGEYEGLTDAPGPMSDSVLDSMDIDDGMPWDDNAAELQQQGRQGNVVGGRPSPEQQRQQQEMLQQQQLQQQQIQQQQQQIQQQQQQQQQQMQREKLLAQQAAAQAEAQAQQQRSLSSSTSRERLAVDPADVTETRKLTVTPNIARESDESSSYGPSQSVSSNGGSQKTDESSKRLREEESDESLRKRSKGKDKMGAPVSSASLNKPNGKLRKERDSKSDASQSDDEGKDKKKKGVFGGLFGRKSKKDKGSIDIADPTRLSDDSGRRGPESSVSPTTAIAMQQQQIQQQAMSLRNSTDPKRIAQMQSQQMQEEPPYSGDSNNGSPQVSQHATQLRQRDQQQQALYQQYLNRSPSSPPEAQPSYGLQSWTAVMPPNSSYSSNSGLSPPTSRPRPGSLILTQAAMDGQGAGVPDLSVIRVFAGRNLQTEATFKTVLLNSSTTSAELVKQAIQRFRLPAAEDVNDYYLTVKQVEGSSAILHDSENPLVVFETLVEAALELPKVKRSSVGSISSVVSNLSMHPAIRKLSMNDFTDDSAVKFYLNRRSEEGLDDSIGGHEADSTLVAADTSMDSTTDSQFLTVSNSNVSAERFSSPSFRFVVQLVIYPDDLPDDMVFDPLTEAIVFKHTLRDRAPSGSLASPGIAQNLRRKVFVFPKNVTVAEVIEMGLERFGILEGVVDGGDEVEDKLNKRMSAARVRYGLAVSSNGQERELSPSSRVIDAFPRPPSFRTVDRRFQDSKRRSMDSSQLLGSIEDINPNDPIFILRRAISYRSSTSRNRLSAPLDEIALANLHRESASSIGSDSGAPDGSKSKTPVSRQEIIAAQRAARRNNQQQAILSAQTNSVRGVDVLLPGNVMLRSSRYDSGNRMRYSYVEPDGETYDISDIIEEEWRETDVNQNDLLEVVAQNKDGAGEKLHRVLSKVKTGRQGGPTRGRTQDSLRSSSPSSQYSIPIDENALEQQSNSRSVTPGSAGLNSRTPIPPVAARAISPNANAGRSSPIGIEDRMNSSSRSTPVNKPAPRRNPSIASVMSDGSGYATAQTNPSISRTMTDSPKPGRTTPGGRATPKLPLAKHRRMIEEDFGITHMLAIIEYKASKGKTSLPPLDPVDDLLFGRAVDSGSLHPRIKDVYASGFKQLEEMDSLLDDFLLNSRRS